jgi:hypothetical protein
MKEIKERPIIFSGPMVRAIFNGSKTQTRRVLKFPKFACRSGDTNWIKSVYRDGIEGWVAWSTDEKGMEEYTKETYPNGGGFLCPYGKAGDILWVRETYQELDNSIVYKADGSVEGKWRPSIYMPRDASRITLEVTNVRVQRLQDISEEDAQAEGVKRNWLGDFEKCPEEHKNEWENYLGSDEDMPCYSTKESFMTLWQSINGKRPGRSWDDNPYVWAISFRRIDLVAERMNEIYEVNDD